MIERGGDGGTFDQNTLYADTKFCNKTVQVLDHSYCNTELQELLTAASSVFFFFMCHRKHLLPKVVLFGFDIHFFLNS